MTDFDSSLLSIACTLNSQSLLDVTGAIQFCLSDWSNGIQNKIELFSVMTANRDSFLWCLVFSTLYLQTSMKREIHNVFRYFLNYAIRCVNKRSRGIQMIGEVQTGAPRVTCDVQATWLRCHLGCHLERASHHEKRSYVFRNSFHPFLKNFNWSATPSVLFLQRKNNTVQYYGTIIHDSTLPIRRISLSMVRTLQGLLYLTDAGMALYGTVQYSSCLI